MKNNKPRQNTIEENGVNVKVIVRCRPLTEQEKKDPNNFNVLQTKIDTKEIVVSQQSLGRKIDSHSTKLFSFDGVCGSFTSQRELFKQYVVPIVDEVLLGFNCTIFAYGQTGTGKTYTMEGDMKDYLESNNMELTEHAGIIPRAVQLIFERLESQYTEYGVRVSYLEIYNEELSDLLSDEKVSLRIYDDVAGKRGLNVDRLEELPVNKAQDILNILSTAVRKRKTAETLLNKSSSRSHCIFTITIHTKETNIDGEDVLKVGKLNLVDLAGSENIQRSGANAVKDRAKEAGMINQSLLTLGRVINALVEHSSYVPYRDSKLTRLLQDSLGGRTKTCIIATITSSSMYLEETLNTLDYAHRAKNIKNTPVVNQKMTKKVMIREMNCEIEKLKLELQSNREKNGVYMPLQQFNEMECKIQSQSNDIIELESELQNQISLYKELESNFNNLNEQLNEKILRVKAGDYANIHIMKHAKLYSEKYHNLFLQMNEALESIGKLHRKIISNDLFYTTQNNQIYKLHEELTNNVQEINIKTIECLRILKDELRNDLNTHWLEKSKLIYNEILNMIDTGKKLCNNAFTILDEALGKSLTIELSMGIKNVNENLINYNNNEINNTKRIQDEVQMGLNSSLNKAKVIENNITQQLEKLKLSNQRYFNLVNEYKDKTVANEEMINDIFSKKIKNSLENVVKNHLTELDQRLSYQITNLNEKSRELKNQLNQMIDSFVGETIQTLSNEKQKICKDIENSKNEMIFHLDKCYEINKNFINDVVQYNQLIKDIQNSIFQEQCENHIQRQNEINNLCQLLSDLSSETINNSFDNLSKLRGENIEKIIAKMDKISSLTGETIQNSIKDVFSVINLQSNSYNELSSCVKDYFDYNFESYYKSADDKARRIAELLNQITRDKFDQTDENTISKLFSNLNNLEDILGKNIQPSEQTPNKNQSYKLPKINERCLSPKKYIDHYLNTIPRPNIDLNQYQKMIDPFYNSNNNQENYSNGDNDDEVQILNISQFIQNYEAINSSTLFSNNRTNLNDVEESNFTPISQQKSIESIQTSQHQTLICDENQNHSQENTNYLDNVDVNYQLPPSNVNASTSSIPKPTRTRKTANVKKINK